MNKALIVDDNVQDRSILRLNMERHGYSVTEARDGLEGLELARKEKPDLIISDALMPRMDGFRLLREIKADPSLAKIPFVFYSAVYTGEDEENLARSSGAAEFIIKPMAPEEFWKELQKALNNAAEPFTDFDFTDELSPEKSDFLEKYSTVVAAKLQEKIHELQAAKQDLERREKDFQNLFSSIRDVIIVADQDRIIINANQPALRETFGYELNEVKNKKTQLLYSDKESFQTTGEQVFNKESSKTFKEMEIDFKRKNGEIFPAELQASKLLDEHGNIKGNLGLIRDVSHRIQIEKKLKDAENDWDRTFEAISDIVTIQNEEKIITRINRAGCDFFKKPLEELQGKFCFELFCGNQELCKSCPIGTKTPTAPGKQVEIQQSILGKPFSITAVPLFSDNGEVKGVVHFARDLTEKKMLEEQLRQSQKMEAIGILAGGVAHDFNNVLTGISGYLELALMKLDPSNKACADLKHAEAAAQRAVSIVRQLMLFSRKGEIEHKKLRVNESVNELMKMIERFIGEDIVVNTNLDQEAWPMDGDPAAIDQILMNLVINARDAMPSGGILEVRTRNVEIDNSYARLHVEAKPGKYVELTISDTGNGMDKETMRHIFEPFFTTKESGRGTGLGLSVVYSTINAHQGWINVYSEPGKGTTFKIFLPASKSAECEAAPQTFTIEAALGLGERILIVEDDKLIREMVKTILQNNGYQACAVGSIQAALQKIKQEEGNFDLLISDLILPDGSGLDIYDEFVKIKPEIKVLICSGYPAGGSKRLKLKEKNTPFLEKPFSASDLLRAVAEIFNEPQ